MIKRDILESVIDVGSGFFLAVIIQLTIFPLFDLFISIDRVRDNASACWSQCWCWC